MLIARVWHGLTSEKLSDEYLHQLEKLRLTAYRRIPGNQGALVFQRKTSGVAEFLVISVWESYDAIRRFTSPKPLDTALYHEEEYRYLLFPEPKVSHYELAAGRAMLLTVRQTQEQTCEDQSTVEPAD